MCAGCGWLLHVHVHLHVLVLVNTTLRVSASDLTQRLVSVPALTLKIIAQCFSISIDYYIHRMRASYLVLHVQYVEISDGLLVSGVVQLFGQQLQFAQLLASKTSVSCKQTSSLCFSD
jgi:hypothetical protein